MATKIDTVKARDGLTPRREPYWHKLSRGSYLGFRKLTTDSAGNWVARSLDSGTGKQAYHALGEFGTLPANERFDAAKTGAEAWFKHLGLGGSTEVVSVKKACEAYTQHLRDEGRGTAADDIDGRFKRWVFADKDLARLDLPKLTKAHVMAWRKGLAKTVVKVNRDQRETPVTRPRSASSVNRDMTALRAALNHALDAGQVTTDLAWRVALKPIKNADGRRALYLDRVQRRKFIDNADADLAQFLRGLSLLPLRPGALAALTVGDYDRRLKLLNIGKDKAGADRLIKLPDATAAMIEEASKDKLPAAPMFSRADGKAWDKDSWKEPIKRAAAAAELPAETIAYTLRHSVITDLVTGGLDLLTVAQISGTSVAMIERHYGQLRGNVAAAALAKLAL